MNLFSTFKEKLRASVTRQRKPGSPTEEILKAIDAADNWESLQFKLVDLRTVSRRRQQEVFERLEPLARKVEELLAAAKEAKFKVMRDNLLRQAETYMAQLEAEDNPAEVHSATCNMLTRVIQQVQRAGAMQESGVTAEAIDAIAAHVEEIVEGYEDATGAAEYLQADVVWKNPAEPDPKELESRLASVCVGETGTQPKAVDSEHAVAHLERRLYESER